MRRPIVTAAVVLLTLASCGGGDTPSGSPTAAAPSGTSPSATRPAASLPATATAVEPEDRPSVSIRSPDDGATIDGGSVTITADVENFEVVNKIGDKKKDGQGHLHFYLDVDDIPTTMGEEAIVEGEGRYVATSSTSYTWSDLSPGSHKLGVQLVNNNHTPLQPPATAEITVTIGGG